jgi:CHAT domain-containing protein
MLDLSVQPHMPLKSDLEKYTVIARRLYDAVIGPAERFLSGRNLALISPDGGLNLVSFSGLIDSDGKYLVENLSVHHLLAGRELVRLGDNPNSGEGLLAIGDPDYDASAADRKECLEIVQHASAAGCEDTTSVRRSGWDFFGGDSLVALPGTRDEIRSIAEGWRHVSDEPVATYFGSQASEDLFKAAAPGKRIIHLATHGYCVSDKSGSPGKVDAHSIRGSRSSENPLLQSGLFFAGANMRGRGADSLGIEDGVLTAYEASAMDLLGTDMVVLSACETGLGEVQQGEGVYGLRRAFQVAGVRTIVSSLWSVSDRETAFIMSQLYTETDETLPDKLRRLQLDRIAKLRADRLTDHPYAWAAFIALGDWR